MGGFFLLDKVVELVGGGSVINGAWVGLGVTVLKAAYWVIASPMSTPSSYL